MTIVFLFLYFVGNTPLHQAVLFGHIDTGMEIPKILSTKFFEGHYSVSSIIDL